MVRRESMARFQVQSAQEVLRDPGGHEHHFTILMGTLVEGTLRVSDPLAIPRVGGGHWLGQVLGFELFRKTLGNSVNAADAAGEAFGVAVRGVAPPRGTVAEGEAYVATLDEARVIATALSELEPAACKHCHDCLRVSRYIGQPC
jgi:hypothetical protein